MKKALAPIVAVCLALAAGCGDNILSYYGDFPDGSACDMPIRETQITELLDGEELNIGNGAEVVSLEGFPLLDPASTNFGPGIEVRILDNQGSSQRGRMITLTVSAELLPTPIVIGGDLVGPLFGILEFGSGNGIHRVEFDLPTGGNEFVGTDNLPQPGTTVVSFPASSFRFLARNDSRRRALTSNLNPVGNAPWLSTGSKGRVTAHASYSTRASVGPVHLTFPMALDNTVPGVILGANNYNIPALAKRVTFRRNPIAAPLLIFFFDGTNRRSDTFVVPAGVNSPVFDVPGQAVQVQLQTGGVGVNELFADYEIAF